MQAGIFRNRWWIVAASFCALLVGSGPINIFAFNVFVLPVTQELGLSRGDFSGALAANGIFNALSVLFMGWALDRYGVRRVQIFFHGALSFSIGSRCASKSFCTSFSERWGPSKP